MNLEHVRKVEEMVGAANLAFPGSGLWPALSWGFMHISFFNSALEVRVALKIPGSHLMLNLT